MNNLDLKILAIAEEICRLYSHELGSRICQDWPGNPLTPDTLSNDEKEELYKQYEQYNSNGTDYEPGLHNFHDGMMLSLYIATALHRLRTDTANSTTTYAYPRAGEGKPVTPIQDGLDLIRTNKKEPGHYIKLANAFDSAKREILEDGMDNSISTTLMPILEEDTEYGLMALSAVIGDSPRYPTLIGESLRHVGRASIPFNSRHKLALFLAPYLYDQDASIWDGALLGLHYIEHPCTCEILATAQNKGNFSKTKTNDIQQVIDYLKETPMSKTIWKYKLDFKRGLQELEMEEMAEVKHVAIQHGKLFMWAEVNPDAPLIKRAFGIHPAEGIITGIDWYVGTALDGDYTWHVYEGLVD